MTFSARGRGKNRAASARAVAAVALAGVFFAGSAARANLGDGLKFGPGRLKLGLEAGARYDSMAAVGLVGATGGNLANPGDGIGLLRGAFDLSVPGDAAKLTLIGNLDWNQFLDTVANLSAFSFFGANVAGSAEFNPQGAFGVDVQEALDRSDRTDNPLFGVGVLGLSNTTSVRARERPGGGAIEIGESYAFGADIYSSQTGVTANDRYAACEAADPTCNPAFASAYNALSNTVGLDAKWHLFPKTGFTLEASYGWQSYLYGALNAGTQAASPLQVIAGFGTLLNTRFTFAVRAGYGGIFFASAPALQGVIGQAEVGYRVSETFSLRGGYQRSNKPVAGHALYFQDDRGYAELRGEFNRLVVTADASLDFIGYGSDAATANPRTDTGLTGDLEADYHLNDWLKLTSRLEVSGRSVANAPEVSSSLGYDYNRWEFGVGVATLF